MESLSARRAWIEIVITAMTSQISVTVALRKESVDRNFVPFDVIRPAIVALRKESVDRNYIIKVTENRPAASLSARRAWIEISLAPGTSVFRGWVALRKESVDRNYRSYL